MPLALEWITKICNYREDTLTRKALADIMRVSVSKIDYDRLAGTLEFVKMPGGNKSEIRIPKLAAIRYILRPEE